MPVDDFVMASKKATEFDTECFIMEIESRPSIWDLSCNDYSNRDVKKKHWEELVDIFGGDGLSDEEKRKLGITLQTRWKSIRDSFSREQRRIKSLKSGSAADRKSPYIYATQLTFLSKCSSGVTTTGSKVQETADTILESSDEKQNGPYDTKREILKRKKGIRKNTDADEDLASTLKASLERRERMEFEAESDSDRLFLLSLLPDLKKIPDNEKLSTKLELMNVIKRKLEVASTFRPPQEGMVQAGFNHWNYNPAPTYGTIVPVPLQSPTYPVQPYPRSSTQVPQNERSDVYEQGPSSHSSSVCEGTNISLISPESELLSLF